MSTRPGPSGTSRRPDDPPPRTTPAACRHDRRPGPSTPSTGPRHSQAPVPAAYGDVRPAHAAAPRSSGLIRSPTPVGGPCTGREPLAHAAGARATEPSHPPASAGPGASEPSHRPASAGPRAAGVSHSPTPVGDPVVRPESPARPVATRTADGSRLPAWAGTRTADGSRLPASAVSRAPDGRRTPIPTGNRTPSRSHPLHPGRDPARGGALRLRRQGVRRGACFMPWGVPARPPPGRSPTPP